MKILYLEDNLTDADLTKRVIKKSLPSAVIHIERTIFEAKKMLQKEKDFDLLLLDLNLPDGDGIELLNFIRRKNIPIAVIILTSVNDEEIAITALKTGANDYLSKDNNYLNKLPNAINQTIKNFKKFQKNKNTNIKILYVERHESDIEFTQRHFKKYAPYMQIKSVPNVIEALNILPKSENEQAKFDVLLIDYRLPGINALEAIKIIRQERKLHIPIVLVTGFGSEEVAVQALKLGADDYLVKRENYLIRLPLTILNVYQKHQLEIKHQELLKSKQEYKSFFEDDLTGDFIATINGKLLNCNPAYIKIIGFSSKEEALNFDVRKLYVKTGTREKIIERLKKEETVVPYEAIIKRRDGKIIQVIGNMVGGYDKNGNLETLKGYIFDDTQRKLAVDELRKLSVAIEQSPVSIIITDLNGKIEYVNKKFVEVTGYSIKEAIGNNPNMLKSGEKSNEDYQKLWETIKSGKSWTGEFQNKKKNGELFWENAVISPIVDEHGNQKYFLAIKEDITEKKAMMNDLIVAKERAEESDRLKSAFIANMSHEIRTPMNGILGFSGLLKTPNLSIDRQLKYINIIEKSGERLLNTINDIMDISKIEAGLIKVTISEFNIVNHITELYTFFKPEADKKGLQLKITNSIPIDESIIKTDEFKLHSILVNLIKNAIKFTHTGSVEISFSKRENQLEIYVKDTGIGIPKDRQPYVYDRFVQADIEDKNAVEGSGLGLAITKSYVEMLGGSIHLDSTESIGSTFSFTIPCQVNNIEYPEVKNELLDSIIQPEISPLKILIVEDDQIAQHFLYELLDYNSNEILVAENGFKALDICKENPNINLILMDIRIPDINGYEVTKQIRKFNNDVIIIAQTAFALSGDKEKSLEAGCNDYLSKPIKKDELISKINKYFRK